MNFNSRSCSFSHFSFYHVDRWTHTHTHTQTDVDERLTPATVIGMSHKCAMIGNICLTVKI